MICGQYVALINYLHITWDISKSRSRMMLLQCGGWLRRSGGIRRSFLECRRWWLNRPYYEWVYDTIWCVIWCDWGLSCRTTVAVERSESRALSSTEIWPREFFDFFSFCTWRLRWSFLWRFRWQSLVFKKNALVDLHGHVDDDESLVDDDESLVDPMELDTTQLQLADEVIIPCMPTPIMHTVPSIVTKVLAHNKGMYKKWFRFYFEDAPLRQRGAY